MFVITQGITKAVGRLEFLSCGLLICILTRYFLISPRNAGQKNGQNVVILLLCAAVHIQDT